MRSGRHIFYNTCNHHVAKRVYLYYFAYSIPVAEVFFCGTFSKYYGIKLLKYILCIALYKPYGKHIEKAAVNPEKLVFVKMFIAIAY